MANRIEIPIVVLDNASPTSPVSGATAVVKNRIGGTAAVVYADSGATNNVVTQPMSTDASGRLSGWLNRGAYEFQITVPGHSAYSEFIDVAPGTDGAVDSAWLADGSVTGAKVSSAIKDAAVGTASLRTIGTGALQATAGNDTRLTNTRTPTDGTVTTVKIVDNSVTTAKIADLNVTTNKIGNLAVTSAKIDSSVTNLFPRSVGGSGLKIARGVMNVFIADGPSPNYGFQGVAHGLGAVPISIQLTGLIASGYNIIFDYHVIGFDASNFSVQVIGDVPGDAIIQVFWMAMS